MRAAAASREAMAGLVAAGADLLVAPTWLTHRRALLPVGETRRAAAWTAAAVRVAREAVDRGLELRELAEAAATEEAVRAGEDPSGLAVPRLPVLVAGVLTADDGTAEADVGRLLPRDAAAERDLRAQAGLLAEAEVDLVLVVGGPSADGVRIAVETVVETGLAAWVSATVTGGPRPTLESGGSIGAWAESMVHAGASVLLVSPEPGADVGVALETVRASGVEGGHAGVLVMAGGSSGWGGAGTAGRAAGPQAGRTQPMAVGPSGAAGAGEPGGSATVRVAAERWIEGGAWHLGIGDGATVGGIEAMRAAIDAVDGARLAARAAARDRWVARVDDAARRAPGGRAAWIGPRDPGVVLPAGFAWAEVAVEALAALPIGGMRLVIATTPVDGERLAALVEPGGVLLAAGVDPGSLVAAGLRIADLDPGPPPTIVARRDP